MTRIRLAASALLASLGVLFGAHAVHAQTNALAFTFQGSSVHGANLISGTIAISSLKAGAPVTGGGTITLISNGLVIYSGGFTATKVVSVTGAFAPQPLETIVTDTVHHDTFLASQRGSLNIANMGVQIQTGSCPGIVLFGCVPSVSPAQDLFITTTSGAVLDVAITLTGSISPVAAQSLAYTHGADFVISSVKSVTLLS